MYIRPVYLTPPCPPCPRVQYALQFSHEAKPGKELPRHFSALEPLVCPLQITQGAAMTIGASWEVRLCLIPLYASTPLRLNACVVAPVRSLGRLSA